MGRLCDQLGIGLGAAFEILHRMAALFRGVIPKNRKFPSSPLPPQANQAAKKRC